MAELRVVDQSSFAFETDLPVSSRDIHPSGIIHACRSTPSHNGNQCREEHIFVWVEDMLHNESALNHLRINGFDCSDGAVFIPYSTKSNWVARYPHAAPALECKDDGEVVVYLNYRPYPNGLRELGQPNLAYEGARAAVNNRAKRERTSGLSDVQRDELHIEIYRYLDWFHRRMTEPERMTAPLANGQEGAQQHVDVQELQAVVDGLETAFFIIPDAEAEDAKKGAPFLEVVLGDALNALVKARKADEKNTRRIRKRQLEQPKKKKRQKKEAKCGYTAIQSEVAHSGTISTVHAWQVLTEEQREQYHKRARELTQPIPEEDDSSDESIDDSIDERIEASQKEEDDRPCRARTVINPGHGSVFDKILKRLELYRDAGGGTLTDAQVKALRDLEGGLALVLFEHPDGVKRRAPPNWEYRGIKVRSIYLMWHCGNEDQKICPIKMWQKEDIRGLTPKSRATTIFGELRQVIRRIDKAAVANGVPPKKAMSLAQANRCFDASKGGLNSLLVTTSTGRKRDLEEMNWTTLLKSIQKEVTEAQMSARKEVTEESPRASGPKIATERELPTDEHYSSLDEIKRHCSTYFRTRGDQQAKILSDWGSRGLGRSYDLFEHPDGINRRIPPNWKYDGIKVRPMYILWHCGDETRRMCPIKFWKNDDIDTLPMKRARTSFSELRTVMTRIDNAAAAHGVPPKTIMTVGEANSCFDAGKVGLGVSLVTPSGRPRNLENISWSSVVHHKLRAVIESGPPSDKGFTSVEDFEREALNYYRTVGVCQVASGNWRVEMSRQGKVVTIGTYKTQDQAAQINEIVRRKREEMADQKQSEEEFLRNIASVREAAENIVGCKRCSRGGKGKRL